MLHDDLARLVSLLYTQDIVLMKGRGYGLHMLSHASLALSFGIGSASARRAFTDFRVITASPLFGRVVVSTRSRVDD